MRSEITPSDERPALKRSMREENRRGGAAGFGGTKSCIGQCVSDGISSMLVRPGAQRGSEPRRGATLTALGGGGQ